MLNPSQVQKTLEIAEEFYGTSIDPEQIPINKESFDKLMSLHQEAIKLKADADGNPISWVVVVPTSKETMESFLEDKSTEKELFDRAVIEKKFESLYLCSAFTVPEYRNKRLATELLLDSIKEFASDNSVQLYAWVYSKEGEGLVNQLREQLGREVKTKVSH
jgi:hypothetical protein